MKDALADFLRAYQWSALDDEDLAEAAVMLLLYPTPRGIHTVFQKRSERVLHHKGQISLPGGAREAADPSLAAAALRETHEEIGVPPESVHLLGRLDDIRTISRFRVTPFVGWFERGDFDWKHSDLEVAYLLDVSLDHLSHPETFVPDVREAEGRLVEMPSYRVGEDLIWGATGRIVSNFLDVLMAAGLHAHAR
ncbi:MAG: CoA pyrophosphatase [Dehalococcoidia bacterium]|nr:CoA pyrophosphatase [Dehalococcoidia bacterium]